MFTYKLTTNVHAVLRSDGFLIEKNNKSDWNLYEVWLALPNNTPVSADILPIIVREVDARRLRLALLSLNLLTQVESAISTLGESALIDWEYATIIKEDYSLVQALSTNLGLNINEIFTLAISL